MKKRLVIISFFVIIFVTFIVVWNFSYQKGLEEAYMPIIETPTGNFIPSESGVFKRSDVALDYLNMPVDENHQRTLKAYYTNRAFPGAPPSIPHPVAKERSLGGNTCLQCHQNGGFVEKYSAYAPITPHPEMVNCRQCHVTKNTNDTFFRIEFKEGFPAIAPYIVLSSICSLSIILLMLLGSNISQSSIIIISSLFIMMGLTSSAFVKPVIGIT